MKPEAWTCWLQARVLGSFLGRASQVPLVAYPPPSLCCFAGDVRDASSIPGSGRSPGEGHGNPLQYSCLENPVDREPGGLRSMGLQKVEHD